MNLYQFNALTFNEQYKYLMDKGTFLHVHREKAGVIYSLYSLHDYYVEVGYNVLENEATGLQTFKSLTPLDDYLNDIDISF